MTVKGRGKRLPDPLPLTATIPDTGFHFFEAGRAASYRPAKNGTIPTVELGTRNKRALPRVLDQRLNRDPKNSNAV
jgi:hypothetical protein